MVHFVLVCWKTFLENKKCSFLFSKMYLGAFNFSQVCQNAESFGKALHKAKRNLKITQK